VNIVITGFGVLGPWGLTTIPAAQWPPPNTSPDGTIGDYDFFAYVHAKNKRTKKMDRLSRIASTASTLAARQACIANGSILPGRGAVISGSALGALGPILDFHAAMEREGVDSIDPKGFPPTSHNVAGGHVSIEFGLSGPLIHFASGRLSSETALLHAMDLLRSNRIDVAFVGVWDVLDASVRRVLAPSLPSNAIEASSVAILERKEHAEARGVAPICRMSQPSLWSDVAGSKAPALRCAREILERYVSNESSVDTIVIHGPKDESLRKALVTSLLDLEGIKRETPIIIVENEIGDARGANGLLSIATAISNRGTRVLCVGMNDFGEASSFLLEH